MNIKYERELYEPIKLYFESLEYIVNAEVKDCDVVAKKGDELIIIELKKSFSLQLLYQAMDRLVITPNVYVAIPRPNNFKRKNVKSMIKLVKQLRIGLIFVGIETNFKNVDIVLLPDNQEKSGNKNKKRAVLKELDSRKTDLNMAGSTSKNRIITAYMEKSVALLCFMERNGQAKISQLKTLDGFENVSGILQKNFHGWFERVSRGTYKLSQKGNEFLCNAEYLDLIEFYRKEVSKFNV